MGKVVKIVAGIAIAAGAFALAAPTGGLSIAGALSALNLSAAVTSMIGAIGAAVFATVATMALNALVPVPGTTAGRQETRGQESRDVDGRRAYPPDPTITTIPAIDQPGWANPFFLPWQRFAISGMRGDCMRGCIDGRWMVLDRKATIRRDDFFVFRPDDLAEYLGRNQHWLIAFRERFTKSGIAKGFVGADPEARTIVAEHTFPPNRIQSGQDRLIWAYRARSVHRSYLAALLTSWRMRRNPALYDDRLAAS